MWRHKPHRIEKLPHKGGGGVVWARPNTIGDEWMPLPPELREPCAEPRSCADLSHCCKTNAHHKRSDVVRSRQGGLLWV